MESYKLRTRFRLTGIGLLFLALIGIGLSVYGIISPNYLHADYVGYGMMIAGPAGGVSIAFLVRSSQIKIEANEQFKGDNKI